MAKKINGFLGKLRASLKRKLNPPILLEFDFEKVYPYKFWVSTWLKDSEYPEGFRYKLLSAKHEEDDGIQLIVLLEKPDGYKKIFVNALYETGKFGSVAQTFVEKLKATHKLTFEEYDLSNIKTLDEFGELAKKHGWQSW
jgi:hypothetical protein